jgi:hypothetical protein
MIRVGRTFFGLPFCIMMGRTVADGPGPGHAGTRSLRSFPVTTESRRGRPQPGERYDAISDERELLQIIITRLVTGFLFFCSSTMLIDNSEKLADAGLTSGSTVQVNLCCLRGASKFVMTDALREDLKKTKSGKHGKYSITREGLAKLFRELLLIARERGYTKDDLTFHDCAALFQGKSYKDGAWAAEKDKSLQFHPMDRFPALFSDKMPDRMISYTRAGFTLIADLPLFLNECEKLHPPTGGGEAPTYWLDIAFNCQNSPDIILYLSIADGLYSGAEMHFAFVCNGMVCCAWCNADFVTRTQAGLRAHGLAGDGQNRTDAIIRAGELLAEGDPAFTVFVAVKDRTSLDTDIMDFDEADRFGRMCAFDPNDLATIKERTMKVFGTPAAFNFAMIVVRNAVLTRFAQQHPVSPPPALQ